MLNSNIMTAAMDIQTGRVRYIDMATREDILATKMDRVVVDGKQMPCYLKKVDGEMSEYWYKNNKEIENADELTDNLVVLPQSQWEE